MDGNENPPLYDDGEVEDVNKKIPKHLRHKKVKDPSSNQISILQTQQIEWLKNYTLEEVKNFEKYCLSVKSTNTVVERQKRITKSCCHVISLHLGAKEVPDYENWANWTDEKFFLILKRNCPVPTKSNIAANSLLLCDRIKSLKLKLDLADISPIYTYIIELKEMIDQDIQMKIQGNIEANDYKEIIKTLINGYCKNNDATYRRFVKFTPRWFPCKCW
jgi:hypothetical protein